MRATFALTLASTAALFCGSCHDEPANLQGSFSWQAQLTDLPAALLALCSHQGKTFLVGGDNQRGLLLRRSNSLWVSRGVASAPRLWWCWGDESDLLVVGENATVLHYAENQGRVEPMPGSTEPTLYGVWGTGAGEFFAVGGSAQRPELPPVAYRYDGDGWHSLDVTGLRGPLFKVWGTTDPATGATAAWAVGAGGTIARLEGQRWVPVPSPTTEVLISIHGTNSKNVYAVGGDGRGLILRYDGTTWRLHATIATPLASVWVRDTGEIVVGGERGVVGRFFGDDSQHIETKTLDPTICIHSIFESAEGTLLAAGGDLFAGATGQWRGALYHHEQDVPARVLLPRDAGLFDATTTYPADANAAPDGGTPPGEICGQPPDCSAGNACWFLQSSGVAICTSECQDSSQCQAPVGAGACCARPGAQTLTRVCIPADYLECQ